MSVSEREVLLVLSEMATELTDEVVDAMYKEYLEKFGKKESLQKKRLNKKQQ